MGAKLNPITIIFPTLTLTIIPLPSLLFLIPLINLLQTYQPLPFILTLLMILLSILILILPKIVSRVHRIGILLILMGFVLTTFD